MGDDQKIDCRLVLWDTWGLDETNYTDDLFKTILQGRLPDGFEMTDRLSSQQTAALNTPENIADSESRRMCWLCVIARVCSVALFCLCLF